MRCHYEVGHFYLYQNNDEMLRLLKTVVCDASDGKEICVLCKGKLSFEKEDGKVFEKCGWIYDEYAKEYVPLYRRA